jgi:hypothetical protein
MIFISFDVGIINMAYCIVQIQEATSLEQKKITILDWKVIDISTSTSTTQIIEKDHTCHHCNCKRRAKYVSASESFFCQTHAKKSTFHLPIVFHSSWLKKDLLLLCDTLSIVHDMKVTKKTVLQLLDTFQTTHCLTILVKKKKNTSEIPLVTLGKNLKELLDSIPCISSVSTVLIENQIAPIANRMKTIQGMIMQYFIMKIQSIDIHFIQAGNKLKLFSTTPSTNKTEKQTYKDHKNNATLHCIRLLETNHLDSTEFFLSKKKDDLADSFLQCIWFLHMRKIVSLQEYLLVTGTHVHAQDTGTHAQDTGY